MSVTTLEFVLLISLINHAMQVMPVMSVPTLHPPPGCVAVTCPTGCGYIKDSHGCNVCDCTCKSKHCADNEECRLVQTPCTTKEPCPTVPQCFTKETLPPLCLLPSAPGEYCGEIDYKEKTEGTRWFYHFQSKKCSKFRFNGCEGNENNFLTRANCEATCYVSTNSDCPMYKCPFQCISGRKRDEKGCETCQCNNPCEGLHCAEGMKCIVQNVKCKKAKCTLKGICIPAALAGFDDSSSSSDEKD